ncbi:MAG TPA: hypothetical protein V6D47_14060 [Oscillatoriaceae cyanobacterium]
MYITSRLGLLGLLLLAPAVPAVAGPSPTVSPSPDSAPKDPATSLTKERLPGVIANASHGDGNAQMALGAVYLEGVIVPEDRALSAHWLSLAARNGYSRKVEQMASMVLQYENGPEDHQLAKELYRDACDAGDLSACSMAGSLSLQDRDHVAQGLTDLRKAAEGGDAGGQLFLGEVLSGLDHDTAGIFPRDDKKALEWLLKAATHGNSYAMADVGKCYEEGRGTQQDFQAARRWYERGSQKGNMACQLALGALYEFGRGGPHDGRKALAIYKKIAATGTLNADERIGRIYEFGRGVPQSYTKAFQWYDKAVEILDSDEACRLGILCEEGKVVPRDVKKARNYYENSRTAEAAFRLGASYASEPPPLHDDQKAMTWLLVAKAYGNKKADSLLAHVKPRLSKKGCAEAVAKAKYWIDFDKE